MRHNSSFSIKWIRKSEQEQLKALNLERFRLRLRRVQALFPRQSSSAHLPLKKSPAALELGPLAGGVVPAEDGLAGEAPADDDAVLLPLGHGAPGGERLGPAEGGGERS